MSVAVSIASDSKSLLRSNIRAMQLGGAVECGVAEADRRDIALLFAVASHPAMRLVAVAAEVRHDVEVSGALDPTFPGWQVAT